MDSRDSHFFDLEGADSISFPPEQQIPTPASTSGGVGTSSSHHSQQRSSSKTWDFFTRIPRDDGMHKAKCNICGDLLDGRTTSGTSHLKRHLNRKHRHDSRINSVIDQFFPNVTQTQLGNQEGNLNIFSYDPTRAQNNLVRYIVKDEQPFTMSENQHFEEFIRDSFTPQYRGFSRNTAKNKILRDFETKKDELKNYFVNFEGNICLTSDMWKSCQDMEYICITAHYIDENWKLNKRILSFKLVEQPFTGMSIGELIINELTSWKINKKIFSITLDNASYNDVCFNYLHNVLSLHNPLFHGRCCAHILNLIVKDGLEIYESSIVKIKKAVICCMSSPKRINLFAGICNQIGLKPRKLPIEINIRWNSTYIMLKVAIKYQKAIDLFILNNQNISLEIIEPIDWANAIFYRDFLRVFDIATKIFCGIYYPTSSTVLYQLGVIDEIFQKYIVQEYYAHMVFTMKEKFNKYFNPLPIQFGIATILDPRYKEDLFIQLLNMIYGPESAQEQSINIKQQIQILMGRYGSNRTTTQINIGTASSSHRDFGGNISLWQRITSRRTDSSTNATSASSDFQRYLGTPPIENEDDFNLLNWWKGQQSKFPVLSALARDILAFPVSTVASEQAFSASGRVISKFRSRLAPPTVEGLMCLRDWYLAEKRQQEDIDKEELSLDFEAMYLGEREQHTSGSSDE